jgi:hypothetical protein
MRQSRFLSVLLLTGLLTAPAAAQEVQLLPCAQINFFAPACVPAAPVITATPPAPGAPPPIEPLFSPATMAPDTPPLLLKLLEEPTLEHARAFLAWQAQRAARMAEVQQLLRQLLRPPSQP